LDKAAAMGGATSAITCKGCSPFDGMELAGRLKSTGLPGELGDNDGTIVGDAKGKYLSRSSVKAR